MATPARPARHNTPMARRRQTRRGFTKGGGRSGVGSVGATRRGASGISAVRDEGRRPSGTGAAALVTGRPPVPAAAYPRRHLWMDGVALRAWDRGLVAAPEFFERLFVRNPPGRVLRFLDGLTSPGEEVALMGSTPLVPMSRAAAGDLFARIGFRGRAFARTGFRGRA